MATITLEVPDELVPHLNALGDRLPTVLQQCLQAPLPNHIYSVLRGNEVQQKKIPPCPP